MTELKPPAPMRIQLSRRAGWRMPDGCVSVARPTRWGNPFVVGAPGVPDAAAAVARYRQWIKANDTVDAHQTLDHRGAHRPGPTSALIRARLRGMHLACWCRPGQPCHADVLLVIANG